MTLSFGSIFWGFPEFVNLHFCISSTPADSIICDFFLASMGSSLWPFL